MMEWISYRQETYQANADRFSKHKSMNLQSLPTGPVQVQVAENKQWSRKRSHEAPMISCGLSSCWRIVFPCFHVFSLMLDASLVKNMTHLPLDIISWCPMPSLQSLRPNCLATGKMRFWDAKMKVGKPMKIQRGIMRGDHQSFSTKSRLARYQNHG